MRIFWSMMLAGGLLLVGLDFYESRKAMRQADRQDAYISRAEDGTGFPNPNNPPPPPPR